jgi:hypothetical protein
MNPTKLLILIALTLFLFSCSKDENSFRGTYEIDEVSLASCSFPIFIKFGNDDCVKANNNIEYCRAGQLIINSNNSVTSSISVFQKAAGTNLVSLNGQGEASKTGNNINICVNMVCSDYTFENNKLIRRYVSILGCDVVLTYRRKL